MADTTGGAGNSPDCELEDDPPECITMDGFSKVRWLITCGLISVIPWMVRSADHPRAPLGFISIESKLTHDPTLEDLTYIAYSLDVVTRIPYDAAEVLATETQDPTELQLEFALGAFRGLGSLLAQDLSDKPPEYLNALTQVLEQTETLLTSIPFLHISVLFNFFHPTDELHIPGRFEETPILSPLQAPGLNSRHIDFALLLLHRTLEDLHTALTLPEAQPIIEFMFQADSQNTHKLADFGYELSLLTYFVLGNIQHKLDTESDSLPLQVRLSLAQARNTYGPSFMRAPFIFESLALRTTQPDAAHIQTEVHGCLQLGSTHLTDLIFTPETQPLSLDGSMAILQFLTDPDIIRDSTDFTHADPDALEKTLEPIWIRYREERASLINQLCAIHPQKPELDPGETTYKEGWCIAGYQPGSVIELLSLMALIEHFALQGDRTALDPAWSHLEEALTQVLAFLKQPPSTEEKSPWDLLIEGALLSLQSTLAVNYPELLEGDYDATSGEAEIKIDSIATQHNFLAMLTPQATRSDVASLSPPDWSPLAEPISRLMEIWLSPAIWGQALRTLLPPALTYRPAPDQPIIPWTLSEVSYRLAERFSTDFANPILSYLGVIRDPGTTPVPFLENLSAFSQDNASQRGNMFRPQPLITFIDAAQASARIPIPNILSDDEADPSLQAWLSAYPCESDPTSQPINPIPFNKTYQDAALTIAEAQKDPLNQNVLNTYVVPETLNFVDALMSSLRLKFTSFGGNTQRLMYIPMLSPVLRAHPERRWIQNPKLRQLLRLEDYDLQDRPPISILVQAALDEDPHLKTDLFAAYQDPHHLPVLYKDAWWPKPELGIPDHIRDSFTQQLSRIGHELISPAIRSRLPEEAQEMATTLQHVIGDGESLWVFNPDTIFLLGDLFFRLLWEQLSTPAWTPGTPPTPIEAKVLQDALIYTALHLKQARDQIELLAEFEDHPYVGTLTPYLQAYLTGPLRSLILAYEAIWSTGTSDHPRLNLDFESRLFQAWVPHDSEFPRNESVFKVGPDTLTLAEGLRRIGAQYVRAHLSKLVEWADNPIPALATPAYSWMTYFVSYHHAPLPPPSSESSLKLQVPEFAPALTTLLSVFSPFLNISATETSWQARMTEDSHFALNHFLNAAGISPIELEKQPFEERP